MLIAPSLHQIEALVKVGLPVLVFYWLGKSVLKHPAGRCQGHCPRCQLPTRGDGVCLEEDRRGAGNQHHLQRRDGTFGHWSVG